jgi:hypothetical protein
MVGWCMNDKLERMWKKVPYQHLTGGTKGKDEKPQSGQQVSLLTDKLTITDLEGYRYANTLFGIF